MNRAPRDRDNKNRKRKIKISPGYFLLDAATVNPLQIESAVASGLPLAASVQAPCASHAQLLHHFPLETKIKRLKFILQIETKV